ncbi:MAG TPA: DUF962 domain-containing protein [Polyangiaceae bacterium]|jgi:uncharacterized membrane protein YGL010W
MKLPRPQHTLREYIDQYRNEHTQLGTKLTHMVGIPMIVAAFPTALVNPPAAGGLFVGGWALQLIGHRVFEKNKPAFLTDPYYLLVGPAWVAVEWMELLRLPIPETFKASSAEAATGADVSPEPPAKHVNGGAAVPAS